MRKNRRMVVQAVLDGQISASELTLKEIEEIRVAVETAIMEKKMAQLQLDGKCVFWDTEGELN